MNIGAYLERIRYAGPRAPNAETLRALHRAHLYAVPFENLDIGRGRRLSLALPDLFDKIVTRRRGGFCYELNGLFGWLLASLGYRVTHLSARVYGGDGGLGPEFDHLVLSVTCPADSEDGGGDAGHWLADVGFGDSFIEPLRLQAGRRERQGERAFGLETHGDRWTYWLEEPGDAPVRQLDFALQPRVFPADFEPMCVYQQTAPESHFTQHRLCTLATPTGRLTLSDNRYIVTEHGQKRERPVDAAEFDRRLKTEFGVDLDRES
jgi:N-hydroxyarylamine O-acetyltransferase